MDPLSVTASLIAILGVARAGVKGLKEVHHCLHHAPREIADLISELERFQALIANVESFVSSQNGKLRCSEDLWEIIKRASPTIKKIIDSVPKPAISESSQSISIRSKERLAWLRRKKVLLLLLHDLRSIRIDLVVQLSLLGAYVTSPRQYRLRLMHTTVSHLVEPSSFWMSA